MTLAADWLIHVPLLLWQAWLVAVVVLVLLAWTRGWNPHWRYAATGVALVKYVLPPMLPLPVGVFSFAPPAGESVFAATLMPLMRSGGANFILILMSLHAAGTAVALARIWILRARLHALAARATVARDLSSMTEVRISTEVGVAMTFGIRKPVILLPAANLETMTSDQIAAVIAHEERHVERRDARAILIESLIAALWWFDPVVRLVIRERRKLREECCDDEVIARASVTPAQYGRAICAAAENLSSTAPWFAPAVSTGSDLTRRIARIAAPGFRPRGEMSRVQIAAIVLIALLLLPGVRVNARNVVAFDHATFHSLGFHQHSH